MARLQPGRLDWCSLEQLGHDEQLRRGDEVLFVPLGGVEVRGRLREAPRTQLLVEPPHGHVLSVPPRRIVADTFRLLFRASDLQVGDEVVVRSRSGREYRGTALAVTNDRLALSTRGVDGMSLRVDHLDLTTVQVLIPLSPVARPSRAFALA